MALAVVERLNLAKDAGARMSRHLINDLNCKLLVCVHVEARLDAGICALAQYLARQLVQIYKMHRPFTPAPIQPQLRQLFPHTIHSKLATLDVSNIKDSQIYMPQTSLGEIFCSEHAKFDNLPNLQFWSMTANGFICCTSVQMCRKIVFITKWRFDCILNYISKKF